MSLRATNKGGDFELVEEGIHPAICYGVIDLGWQYSEMFGNSSPKIALLFEVTDQRLEVVGADKKKRMLRMAISGIYTASTNEKSHFRRIVEGWRGKTLTETEIADFNVAILAGKHCQLQVIHKANSKGNTRAQIQNVLPKEKGQDGKEPPENKIIIFDWEKVEEESDIPFDKMPEWIGKLVKESTNYEKLTGAGRPKAKAKPASPPDDDDDDFDGSSAKSKGKPAPAEEEDDDEVPF